ncbi:amino acid transporter [groundwater metagenome]
MFVEIKKSYKKSLGTFELVSLGVGGTIGSGIFVVPGIAAGIAGPSSLIAWLIVAISASCVMLSFAWSSSRYPSTGAFFSILTKGFNKKISAAIVILYMVSSVFGNATIAAGIGQYLSFFGFQNVLPIEVMIIFGFCIVNIRGVSLSGITENILTTLKTVPLLVIALLLIPHIRMSNFVPFYPAASMDFLKAIIIVYWTFTGFEICAIPADETKGKNLIFRSLIIVMGIVIAVYALVNISLIGSVGSAVLARSPAPVFTASGLVFGESEKLVAIIGIIAMLSALNAYMLGTSRVIQNLSSHLNVPWFRDLSASGTPAAATILTAILSSTLLLFSNRFYELASISVVTALLPYLFICMATYKIFQEGKIRLIACIGAATTAAILVISFMF